MTADLDTLVRKVEHARFELSDARTLDRFEKGWNPDFIEQLIAVKKKRLHDAEQAMAAVEGAGT